jgi:nucleoside-diphosphate-sugar epimerase
MAALIARAAAARRTAARTFEVWGSLDTVRDLLYVTDQIDAVIAADATFQDTIVNCTPNAPVTIGQCAEAITQALGWEARIVQPPDSFQGAGYKSLDSARFLAVTNWRPDIALIEGVRRVLQADFGEGRAP